MNNGLHKISEIIPAATIVEDCNECYVVDNKTYKIMEEKSSMGRTLYTLVNPTFNSDTKTQTIDRSKIIACRQQTQQTVQPGYNPA